MDKGIAELYTLVEEVFSFVRGPAQSMEIGAVERSLLAMLMRVGWEALITYLERKGSGYQGREIVKVGGEWLLRDGLRGLFGYFSPGHPHQVT
jgi:hypothetical protein